MPLYEFECKAGHRTDIFMSVSGAKRTVRCEQCGKRARRVMSRVSIIEANGIDRRQRREAKPSSITGALETKKEFDTPEMRQRIKEGKEILKVPKGTPSAFIPEALKEKTIY